VLGLNVPDSHQAAHATCTVHTQTHSLKARMGQRKNLAPSRWVSYTVMLRLSQMGGIVECLCSFTYGRSACALRLGSHDGPPAPSLPQAERLVRGPGRSRWLNAYVTVSGSCIITSSLYLILASLSSPHSQVKCAGVKETIPATRSDVEHRWTNRNVVEFYGVKASPGAGGNQKITSLPLVERGLPPCGPVPCGCLGAKILESCCWISLLTACVRAHFCRSQFSSDVKFKVMEAVLGKDDNLGALDIGISDVAAACDLNPLTGDTAQAFFCVGPAIAPESATGRRTGRSFRLTPRAPSLLTD
jgi:hypothetical protein